jgi:hypothetical protein
MRDSTRDSNCLADCIEYGLVEVGAPQFMKNLGDVYKFGGDGSGKPVDLVDAVRSQKRRSDADNEFRPDRQLTGGERGRERFLGDSLKRLADLEEGIKSDAGGNHDQQRDRAEGELKPALEAETDFFFWDCSLPAGLVTRIRYGGFAPSALVMFSLRALHQRSSCLLR